MDTRTGYIYGGSPEEVAAKIALTDAYGRTRAEILKDLAPVSRLPLDTACPKCHGTGVVPRGLGSKRFKPCSCTT